MTGLLVLVPLLPLLLALALFVPGIGTRAVRWLPWATLPALALAAVGVEGGSELPWVGLGLRLEMDAPARLFLLVAGVLWGAAALLVRGGAPGGPRARRHALFFLLMMAGGFGLFLARDPFGFLTCSALASFAGYGLVRQGAGEGAAGAGRVYIVAMVAAEVLLFEAVVLLSGDQPPRELLTILFLVAFGIKAALFPVHVWLPPACHATRVPTAMALLAGLVTAAVFGWQRFLPAVAVPLPATGAAVALAGAAGIVLGALGGLTQRDPKAVLGYAVVVQVGSAAVAVGEAVAVGPAAWAAVGPSLGLFALHLALPMAALLVGVTVAAGVRDRRARRWVLAGLAFTGAVSAAAAPGALVGAVAGMPAADGSGDGGGSALFGPLPALASAVVAALMVRLLGLLRTHTGDTDVEAPPWRLWALLLVAAGAGGAAARWFLGVETPGGSLWPSAAIGAAVALPFLALRLPGRWTVPVGDVVVLYAALLDGVWRLSRGVAVAGPRLAAVSRLAVAGWWTALALVGSAAGRVESALGRWHLATAVLVVVLALLFLVAAGG